MDGKTDKDTTGRQSERLGSRFNDWLETQPEWVQILTQSDIVKDAMERAYFANAQFRGGGTPYPETAGSRGGCP
jgi:hypothetical protein